MKLTVQPPSFEIELTDVQITTLRGVADGEIVYSTSGNLDELDDIERLGLVRRSYGGGVRYERYHLTQKGKLVLAALPAPVDKDFYDETNEA